MAKLTTTKNYSLFNNLKTNRDLKNKKHRKLFNSMKKYGFLECFPVVCTRVRGKLVVLEGQHRVAFAQELGLPISYMVVEEKFDIAEVNSTQIPWSNLDYAESWAKSGKEDYQYGIEFSAQYNLPIMKAFSLLSGMVTVSSGFASFKKGEFKAVNKEKAHVTASTYVTMISISSTLKTSRFLEALSTVCRLDVFEPARLIQKAKGQTDKLVSYSTREAYIDMIESVYNFRAQNLVPLSMMARMELRKK